MPSVSRLEPITILQNRWYNGLITHLNLDQSLFQIHQSINPIIASNSDRYTVQNHIPPLSLTFNTAIGQPDRFSDEYGAIVSQLEPPENKFREAIGEKVYQKWLSHLKTITPPPSENKLPALFRQWAIIAAPSVMSVGVSHLSKTLLVNRALKNWQAYQGVKAKPIDFNGDYPQMLDILKNSTGASFILEPNTTDENVEHTWAKGEHSGLFGLWNNNCYDSRLSRKFALSNINVALKFKSYAVCTAVPGQWYDSASLNTALANPNAAPWPSNPNPTWNEIFGENGSMKRLIISLVVADGVEATVSSDTIFCHTDQQTILANVAKGLWPFYVPTKSSIANNVISFDHTKGMTLKTVTQPGNPLLIGCNVLPIAQYLGHAIP